MLRVKVDTKVTFGLNLVDLDGNAPSLVPCRGTDNLVRDP